MLVTYSHEIEVNSSGYNLNYHQNLTIIGINSTTVVTKDREGLQFSGNGSMSMKSIIWYKCGSDDECFKFNSLYTVEIENCVFTNSTGITFNDVLYILIDKCVFHDNTLTYNAAVFSTCTDGTLNVLNSVFQRNQGPLIVAVGFHADVNIRNCYFEDNNVLIDGLISLENYGGSLNITWCNFANNSASSIIYIFEVLDNPLIAVEHYDTSRSLNITWCIFTNNSAPIIFVSGNSTDTIIGNNNFSLNYIPSTITYSAVDQNALLVLLPTKSLISISSFLTEVL